MGWEGPGMGLGENFFWGSDQTTGTTGTTGSGWLSLFWLFRTACYLNPAPRIYIPSDAVCIYYPPSASSGSGAEVLGAAVKLV